MDYWTRSDDVIVAPEDLIDFAWSAPMRDLAASVGMSDTGLKKLLRSRGIVLPPQGYWNKVRAGKPVPSRPKPAPRRPGETGRINLDARFAAVLSASPPIPVDGPFASTAVPEDLEELRQIELKALGRIATPRDFKLRHPGLAQLLTREDTRRAKVDASPYLWNEPVFDTPLGQRKLRILNGVFLALAKRGHSGDAYERDGELYARVIVGKTAMSIGIDIAGKHPTVLLRGYSRPSPDLPVSTPLLLSIDPSFDGHAKQSWCDDQDGKLETKIARITADIIVAGEAAFRESLALAVKRAEERRQIYETARLERLAALDAKRVEALQRSGELLRRAEDMRALIRRVKDAIEAGDQQVASEDLAAWETWALGQADRLDPVKSGQVLSHLHPPEES